MIERWQKQFQWQKQLLLTKDSPFHNVHIQYDDNIKHVFWASSHLFDRQLIISIN